MKKIFFFILSVCSFLLLKAQSEFITVWKTDNPGVSASNQITIIGSDNYSIVWEDVNNLSINGTATGSNTTTVTFPSPGTYRVKMLPVAPTTEMAFSMPVVGSSDGQKLLTVEQWGTFPWQENMEGAFRTCSNLDITATDIPDFSTVTNMSRMFSGCSNLIGNSTMSSWNTANVLNMSSMFTNAAKFNQPIGTWNTANVANMLAMFSGASEFNQPIGGWNTANVVNMSSMFTGAVKFNQPIDSWNTAKVTDMSFMFTNASMFNQPLGNWNTSNVTNMRVMFHSAGSFNQDISSWDVSKVTTMSNMFASASIFNQPLNAWNTANVRDFSWMFWQAPAFNQPIENWNTGAATNMSSMFYETSAFNQPIGNWNTSNVTTMRFMFASANVFNQSLDQWNTSNVTDMSSMFQNTAAFSQPLNSWDVSKVTDMSFMFSFAEVFNQPLDQWSTSSATNMSYMFQTAKVFNQNIGSWNLNAITPATGLEGMFNYSGLNCVNYDATLEGWASAATTPNNVRLGAELRIYSSASAVDARTTLTTTKGWIITGDTYDATCNQQLPVLFGDITATFKNHVLTVNWSTINELNNHHFRIEGSADGIVFHKLGEVASQSIDGTSSVQLDYSFEKQLTAGALAGVTLAGLLLGGLIISNRKNKFVYSVVFLLGMAVVMFGLNACNKSKDAVISNESGKIFIRIAQVDIDGTTKYSKTVQVINE